MFCSVARAERLYASGATVFRCFMKTRKKYRGVISLVSGCYIVRGKSKDGVTIAKTMCYKGWVGGSSMDVLSIKNLMRFSKNIDP